MESSDKIELFFEDVDVITFLNDITQDDRDRIRKKLGAESSLQVLEQVIPLNGGVKYIASITRMKEPGNGFVINAEKSAKRNS